MQKDRRVRNRNSGKEHRLWYEEAPFSKDRFQPRSEDELKFRLWLMQYLLHELHS